MKTSRSQEFLVPFLSGLGVGVGMTWWLPGPTPLVVGFVVLLLTLLLKFRVGYVWPWDPLKPEPSE